MKRKILIYGTAAFLLLTALLAMDRFKLYKEEKPPQPVVTVQGKEIPLKSGGYVWRGTKEAFADPIKKMADMEAVDVVQKQRLDVNFPADQQPESIIISQVNSVPGGEKMTEESSSIIIPRSQTSRPIHFQITASWDKDFNSFSTYYVKLQIEDLPDFYDFLSKDPKKLSILAIVPRGDSEKYELPEELKAKLAAFHISEDPEGLGQEYPEMSIPMVPIYLIFNSKELIMMTSNKEELLELLKN